MKMIFIASNVSIVLDCVSVLNYILCNNILLFKRAQKSEACSILEIKSLSRLINFSRIYKCSQDTSNARSR